jgi:REP element-mobilizing transposase RayT
LNEGAVYHVTLRGNERKFVFRDDGDREVFLDTLHKVNKRYNLLQINGDTSHIYWIVEEKIRDVSPF